MKRTVKEIPSQGDGAIRHLKMHFQPAKNALRHGDNVEDYHSGRIQTARTLWKTDGRITAPFGWKLLACMKSDSVSRDLQTV